MNIVTRPHVHRTPSQKLEAFTASLSLASDTGLSSISRLSCYGGIIQSKPFVSSPSLSYECSQPTIAVIAPTASHFQPNSSSLYRPNAQFELPRFSERGGQLHTVFPVPLAPKPSHHLYDVSQYAASIAPGVIRPAVGIDKPPRTIVYPESHQTVYTCYSVDNVDGYGAGFMSAVTENRCGRHGAVRTAKPPQTEPYPTTCDGRKAQRDARAQRSVTVEQFARQDSNPRERVAPNKNKFGPGRNAGQMASSSFTNEAVEQQPANRNRKSRAKRAILDPNVVGSQGWLNKMMQVKSENPLKGITATGAPGPAQLFVNQSQETLAEWLKPKYAKRDAKYAHMSSASPSESSSSTTRDSSSSPDNDSELSSTSSLGDDSPLPHVISARSNTHRCPASHIVTSIALSSSSPPTSSIPPKLRTYGEFAGGKAAIIAPETRPSVP
ncbi:hypothetical protein BDN70DRAFT_997318 [Pholiota conissans]|uniref:Uncharacterized protein n=1 Tax=Pholiota conissans TaxID=109636 RepID=A0A9P6CVC2_9AGAR|nr:hypothetical protein BDN70DRAFT_997318 [Pholiota conissans]